MRSENGEPPSQTGSDGEHCRAAAPQVPLSQRLKAHTKGHHRRAERAGAIRAITGGTITPPVYRRYLRSLHPVYAALERRLATANGDGMLDPLTTSALARAPALESDLAALAGPGWRHELPEVPASGRYVLAIESADLAGLMAHAYVRYLGDLNGGAVLRRMLKRALGLPDQQLAFYRFAGIENPPDLVERIRALIDVTLPATNHETALNTAAEAFELNIALATEVLPDAGA